MGTNLLISASTVTTVVAVAVLTLAAAAVYVWGQRSAGAPKLPPQR